MSEPKKKKPRRGRARGARDPLFALTVPERTVRSVLGTAGHAAREITHVLVPPAVRETRFWTAAIERSLAILAEEVGRVPAREAKKKEQDLARLAVGSVVDTAALLVFHVSPLWLLAVVQDVAKGSRRYLDEVVQELRARGALVEDVQVEGVDHLLAVLERASGRLQSGVDRPPLSVAELRASVEEIRGALAERPVHGVAEEAHAIGAELEEVSRREGRSLREISNAVALHAVHHARFAGKAASAGVGAARRLVVEEGWNPYREQLREVRRLGFGRYLANAAAPLGDALAANFDPCTDTLTAQLVSGRLWRAALRRLRGTGARD